MKRIMIFLGVTLILLASCADFLDPESKSEYIPEDVSSLNSLLIQYDFGTGSISSLLELLDDDVAVQPTGISEIAGFTGVDGENAFELFTWQSNCWQRFAENGGTLPANVWANVYANVLKFNAVLDYINEVNGTDEMRNWVRGQALALRSYHYFWLVNIFGAPYHADPEALGIVLKLTSAVEPGSLSRITVRRTYEQIVNDLLEAERCLENTSEMNAYNRNYRMNLPVVRLLLSRVYLYMENWTEAARYATKVIEDEHCILQDFNAMTTGGYKWPNIHAYSNPEALWVGDANGRPVFTLLCYNKDKHVNKNRLVFRASDELVALFDENDLRREYYLQLDTLYLGNGDRYDYYRPFSKFAVKDDGTGPQVGSIFYMSLRSAEAYINRAEANAMLHAQGAGDMQDVFNDIETVQTMRFRKGAAPMLTAGSAEELIQLVRDERRREFCFEYTRWFDLRRYGMSKIKHEWGTEESASTWKTYTLTEGDRGYTLPLPQSALEDNPGLVQNPLASRREN